MPAEAGEVRPSPNIWQHPDVYERLNRAAFSDGQTAALVAGLLAEAPEGPVLDVGCGTGFHLPWLADVVEGTVIGLEPNAALLGLAQGRRRSARDGKRVRLLLATAQRTGLRDGAVAAAFSHLAYFFGPGCEPGLREMDRILVPGGLQVVVDFDATDPGAGYAHWLRLAQPELDAAARDRFFSARGFTTVRFSTLWRFGTWAELGEVLAIEFPPAVARRAARQAQALSDSPLMRVPMVMRSRRTPAVASRLVRHARTPTSTPSRAPAPLPPGWARMATGRRG